VPVPSSWLYKCLSRSLSLTFKEKFLLCSGFCSREYEDFLILMRVTIVVSFVCHSFLDAMGDCQTEHQGKLL
jgi:hypothetical protein